MKRARTRVLPAIGRAIISTDIHGNEADFLALRRRFVDLRGAGVDVHWILLGDLVHGPSDQARRDNPELYDYEDASPRLVEAALELRRALPERVHVVLGNHDHGHVGGPPTHRFHADEAQALESRCTPAQRAAIRELFGEALLSVAAPCGILMAHGCPDDRLDRFDELDEVSLLPGENAPHHRHLLATFTRSYGQPEAVVRRLLRAVSRSAAPVQVMVHGHERDEAGWYSDGDHHLCPILFGAPAKERRYLEVDLGAVYRSSAALVDGGALRRVHGESTGADPRIRT